MINRKAFYDHIRPLFGGKIEQKQVDGIEAILNKWEADKWKDLRWLAYILATTFHETAKTMQPIKEYGRGKGYPYGEKHPKTGKIYYGRGLVQLTWDYNYLRFSKLLGIDLYNKPDLACDMEIAVKIIFIGMIQGMFTGKSLGQYFNEDSNDDMQSDPKTLGPISWVEARRIVNGKDKADLIAKYAVHFHNALA